MDWITAEKYYHHITGNQIHKTIIKEVQKIVPENNSQNAFTTNNVLEQILFLKS